MKKLPIVLALATVLSASVSHAQEPKKQRDPVKMEQKGQERAEERTEQLVKDLGLNDEQGKKVGVINSDFAKAMTDLKMSGVDEETRKTKSKALRQQRESDLKSVLTEEQYAKLLEIRQAKRAEHKEKRAGAMSKPAAQ
jgi:periplasmic protein CpxP/Spy